MKERSVHRDVEEPIEGCVMEIAGVTMSGVADEPVDSTEVVDLL